jgi:uncharacterized protein with ParB-like and HNH nuclease domain
MDTITGPRELGMLFQGCVLRVPPYQRAYAWSCQSPLQNLQDFLGDLRNHPTDQDKDYFYGTILLSKVGGGVRGRLKSYDLYDVVDGQQRLLRRAFL